MLKLKAWKNIIEVMEVLSFVVVEGIVSCTEVEVFRTGVVRSSDVRKMDQQEIVHATHTPEKNQAADQIVIPVAVG